jgi:hypothetical protein
MKTLLDSDCGYSYVFVPGTAGVGTITISGLSKPLILEQVLVITNVTDGIIIYNFADPGRTGSVANNVITLSADTSSMSSADALQIFVDICAPEMTEYEQYPLDIGYDYDVNMAQVLGTLAANDGQGNIKTKSIFNTARYIGMIRSSNEEFSVPCDGFQTAAIQLSGTWTGTVSFDANTDGGNWTAIDGIPISGTSASSGSTGNGIFRFNVAGITRIRARFSTPTSGTVTVSIALSAGQGVVTANKNRVQGSQGQDLVQRASSYELNTWDNNLATVLGNVALWRPGFTAVDPIVAPTINPTQPTTYASNQFAQTPQIFPRLRVEIGGSTKLPFAQEQNTNAMLTANPVAVSLLEQILIQLTLLNQNYVAANASALPNGQTDIR